jgi:UDP-N-acetylglucosamine 2-epimerase (non-hydrolysing)
MNDLCLVAGTRPNFMKIAPLVRELARRPGEWRYSLVHTGQHFDREMNQVFFEDLEIPAPDVRLEFGGATHAEQTARVMTEFEKTLRARRPDMVIVVGDVNSTLACGVVAKKEHLALAHIEAGLRSRDLTMPEEVNRLVVDAISDVFYVTEKSGVENLRREGKPAQAIRFVGHVMIDNLMHQVEKLKRIDASRLTSSGIKHRLREYAVLTLHRPGNVDDRATLERLVGALEELAAELPIVFPVHPRTRHNLERYGLRLSDRIVATPPLGYLDFLNLWKDARVVLTDSGGIQEETTALGVPCLTLRENTERPITLEEGTNELVGSERRAIVAAARRVLAGGGKRGRRPELWDGRAAERIVQHLGDYFAAGLAKAA